MKPNSFNGDLGNKSIAVPKPVSRAMVHTHTRELALIAGRTPANVTQADYEQARREVTGESDTDRQDAILDSFPEEKGWAPTVRSTGPQAPESASGADGRTETDQLVEDGAKEAGLDQRLQAAIAAEKEGEWRNQGSDEFNQ